MSTNATVTITLRQETTDRLNRLALETRQTPSLIVEQALDAHLETLDRSKAASGPSERYARLTQFKGAIAKLNGPRSKEDIDSDIRWLRDND